MPVGNMDPTSFPRALDDLLRRANFVIDGTQSGYYKLSTELDAFPDKVFSLERCIGSSLELLTIQLRRHDINQHLSSLIKQAGELLATEEKYLQERKSRANGLRLTKSSPRRYLALFIRRAFPNHLEVIFDKILQTADVSSQQIKTIGENVDRRTKMTVQSLVTLRFLDDGMYMLPGPFTEVRKALEEAAGPDVVIVCEGSAMGKVSLGKYVFSHYRRERETFPDGVCYLYCGKGAEDRVEQLWLALLEDLGCEVGAADQPSDSKADAEQEANNVPSHEVEMKLRSRLAQKKLLIIIDGVWEIALLEKLLVHEKGIKYLVFLMTWQWSAIASHAKVIGLGSPSLTEVRKIENLDEGSSDSILLKNDGRSYKSASGRGNDFAITQLPMTEFSSAAEKVFNPSQVLCKYKVRVSTNTVELIFCHIEGMSCLLGIGLPLSRVLVKPELNQILIEEMSENFWKDFWKDSYHGPFIPVIFEQSSKNLDMDAQYLSTLDLSTEEVLSRFGVGLEGKNQYDLVVEPRTCDRSIESRIVRPRYSWMSWCEKLLKGGANNGDGSSSTKGQWVPMKEVPSHTGSTSKVDIRHSLGKLHLEAAPSTLDESRLDVTAEKHMVQAHVKMLVVDVLFNHCDCKLYDKESDVHESQRQDFATDKCTIKPKMTMEFLWDTSAEGASRKRLNVRLDVEYQFDGNISDPDKFGWYQNNLRLNFECQEPTTVNIFAKNIISPMAEREGEFTSSLGQAQSSVQGSSSDFTATLGHQGSHLGLQKGSSTSSTQGSNAAREDKQKYSHPCLCKARGFTIADRSIGQRMAYRASFYHDFSNYMWDTDRCEREVDTTLKGLFSNVGIEVEGSWYLMGKANVIHELSAWKELRQYKRAKDVSTAKRKWYYTRKKKNASQNVGEITLETLWQKINKKFTIDHSFSHFQNLEQSVRYQWTLKESQDTSPIPALIKESQDTILIPTLTKAEVS